MARLVLVGLRSRKKAAESPKSPDVSAPVDGSRVGPERSCEQNGQQTGGTGPLPGARLAKREVGNGCASRRGIGFGRRAEFTQEVLPVMVGERSCGGVHGTWRVGGARGCPLRWALEV
jgi:hypothetical protein